MAGPSRTCTSELLFQKTDRVLGWESSDPLGSSPARLGLSFLLGSTTGLDTLIPRPLSALPLHSLTFPSGAAGSALGKVQALSQHQGQGPRGALRRTQGHFLASPDDLRGSGAGIGWRRGEGCVCLGECCGGRWGGEGGPGRRGRVCANRRVTCCAAEVNTKWRNMCMRLCAQSCPTLWEPMDCSPPGSSVDGVFQARTLHSVAISSSGASSQPRDRTHIS